MTWGTVSIDGFDLRETVSAQNESGAVRISGQNSAPPETRAAVAAAYRNIVGLRGRYVGVVFTDKEALTGFYLVTDSQATLSDEQSGSVVSCSWQLTLVPVGRSGDVEIESRVPIVGRSTDTGQSASFWHAPAIGADTYYTGGTVPSGSVDRSAVDGVVRVFTGIPNSFAPRWTVPAEQYHLGGARLLFDGVRALGDGTPDNAVWEVNNGLVKIESGPSGAVRFSAWSGVAWESVKDLALAVSGSTVTDAPDFTVLRNGLEEVAVRLTYPASPGRLTIDLSLRRGARFAAGVIKRHSSADMGIGPSSGEAASAIAGGIRATNVDADGNRYVLGSSHTPYQGPSYISHTGTVFDFFFGYEIGSAPVAGDQALDLLKQYLGSTSERVRMVSR